MFYAIVIVFLLAAGLGIYLISFLLTNKATPKGIAFTHGSIAGLGIILLLLYTICYQPHVWPSLVIFIAAALGGFYLIFRDITGKYLPKWLPVIHGLLAITAFGLLLFLVVNNLGP